MSACRASTSCARRHWSSCAVCSRPTAPKWSDRRVLATLFWDWVGGNDAERALPQAESGLLAFRLRFHLQAHGLRRVARAQLAQHVGAVDLDRARTDRQFAGDRFVATALRSEEHTSDSSH